MSAYRQMKTVIRDGDALTRVLKAKFKVVERHATPQSLYDYHGKVRPEVGEIIVRRQYVQASANDLGYLKGTDGTYAATVSQFDSGRFGQKFLDEITRDYQEDKAMQLMESNEATLEERVVNPDGSVRLRFYVNA
jgi:hypothetical protein